MEKSDIIKFFNLYNSKPSKKLGQNFLIDPKVIKQIVNELEDVNKNEKILEIGSGLGSLTNELIKINSNLTCVEYDKRLYNYLDKVYKNNARVLNIDFLKFKEFDFKYVIGNLPYYITSDILENIVLNFSNIKKCVLMTQQEFFERVINDKRSENSPLSLIIKYKFNYKIVTKVSKSSFFPSPNVDSIVFSLNAKDVNQKETTSLYKCLKISFSHKRKTLENNLKINGLNQDIINKIIFACNIKKEARPEELKIDDFLKLTNLLSKNKVI